MHVTVFSGDLGSLNTTEAKFYIKEGAKPQFCLGPVAYLYLSKAFRVGSAHSAGCETRWLH